MTDLTWATERGRRERFHRYQRWWRRLLGQGTAYLDGWADGDVGSRQSILAERQHVREHWWGWTDDRGGHVQAMDHGDGSVHLQLAYNRTIVSIRLTDAEAESLGAWLHGLPHGDRAPS